MSTKVSLASGEKFHLYTDVWDGEAVWLQIDGDRFEVSERGATIRIPLAIWEYIRAVQCARFDLVCKSGNEFEQLARAAAREIRMQRREYVGKGKGKRQRRSMNRPSLLPSRRISAARLLADLKTRKHFQQRILRAIGKLRKGDPVIATPTASETREGENWPTKPGP